jgi:hypothetical protein
MATLFDMQTAMHGDMCQAVRAARPPVPQEISSLIALVASGFVSEFEADASGDPSWPLCGAGEADCGAGEADCGARGAGGGESWELEPWQWMVSGQGGLGPDGFPEGEPEPGSGLVGRWLRTEIARSLRPWRCEPSSSWDQSSAVDWLASDAPDSCDESSGYDSA